jgi:hypothetical protein
MRRKLWSLRNGISVLPQPARDFDQVRKILKADSRCAGTYHMQTNTANTAYEQRTASRDTMATCSRGIGMAMILSPLLVATLQCSRAHCVASSVSSP